MADAPDTSGTVLEADGTGVIGEHAAPSVQPFIVAPTRETLGNGLAQDITPMACLNLGDVLFEFDSSVVLPAAGAILAQLPGLRRTRANAKGDLPLVSVFAHADPAGDDDYNKTLSGRRARAVYALLIHDVGMWDALYQSPFGGDDWSKKMNLHATAQALGLPANASRHQVFEAQMNAMCPEPLDRADFLGRGADPKGKADFQGCGEFNPLLMLSADDQTQLKKTERDALNLVNRRVVVFLFRPEVKIDVGSWPCPRATEGTADCRKRFFLDAPTRRTPGETRVQHRKSSDETFACRFYDRIAGASPCEQILELYRVRLFDLQANPLPGAPFVAKDGKRTITDKAGDDAFATIRDIKVPADIDVQWTHPDDADRTFSMQVHVEIEGADDSASLRRLHNLGYEGHGSQEADVKAFQHDHASRFPEMTETGQLDGPTAAALEQVNDDCDPAVREDPVAAGSGKGQKASDSSPLPDGGAGPAASADPAADTQG